jgi:hypothetical protein
MEEIWRLAIVFRNSRQRGEKSNSKNRLSHGTTRILIQLILSLTPEERE